MALATDDAGTAPTTPQLKPVGRVSLAVEVPLEGTAFHFRKVKDHAKLEIAVVQPWESRKKVALWALLVGAVVFSGVGWLRKRRRGPR